MINYSIYLRTNPMDKEEAPKAYGVAQYNSVMTIDKFAAHIASHGCVYSRADIAAVLTLSSRTTKTRLHSRRRQTAVTLHIIGCITVISTLTAKR